MTRAEIFGKPAEHGGRRERPHAAGASGADPLDHKPTSPIAQQYWPGSGGAPGRGRAPQSRRGQSADRYATEVDSLGAGRIDDGDQIVAQALQVILAGRRVRSAVAPGVVAPYRMVTSKYAACASHKARSVPSEFEYTSGTWPGAPAIACRRYRRGVTQHGTSSTAAARIDERARGPQESVQERAPDPLGGRQPSRHVRIVRRDLPQRTAIASRRAAHTLDETMASLGEVSRAPRPGLRPSPRRRVSRDDAACRRIHAQVRERVGDRVRGLRVRIIKSARGCHSACQPPAARSCSCGIAARIVATSPGARMAAATAVTARTGFCLCGMTTTPHRRPPGPRPLRTEPSNVRSRPTLPSAPHAIPNAADTSAHPIAVGMPWHRGHAQAPTPWPWLLQRQGPSSPSDARVPHAPPSWSTSA